MKLCVNRVYDDVFNHRNNLFLCYILVFAFVDLLNLIGQYDNKG